MSENSLAASEKGGEPKEIGGCLGSQAHKTCFQEEGSDDLDQILMTSKMSPVNWLLDIAT